MKTKLRWESNNPFERLDGKDGEGNEIEIPLSPAEKVFSIFELAQHIFLDLPPRDILVNIQRTCKQFQAIVAGSKPLQQALFLEPISNIKLQLAACSRRYRCGGKWILSTERNWGCRDNKASHCIWIHPLIHRIEENDPKFEARCTYVKASWRKQLASQPPMSECVLLDDDDAMARDDNYVKAENPKGMLFSQIAKLCTGYARKNHILVEGVGGYDWAWENMPAGELLEGIRASAHHHDDYSDCNWCGSGGHCHDLFGEAKDAQEAKRAQLQSALTMRAKSIVDGE
ncbi:hypothetical protein CKM354_000473100 [Cercospora kikuchii]|uniref:F-box domain-containing protein n=1 Tax=Cercospora kikuchii TaxID=84275 RepID=A0A9P3CDV1_9PEZI|nr:uncharacterized protein CKM354_000473100 [Cercospora kikuchii]GIZ41427.1 hypothetical protein CKM354_000473100 [Cercospora kikuchii]